MRSIKILLAILMMAAFTVPAFSQDTITVSGSSLVVKIGNGTPKYIPCANLTFNYSAPNVKITNGVTTYTVQYSQVTVPSHSSLNNLFFKLDSMADVGRSYSALGFTRVHKSTKDSTTLKSGSGVLHLIQINTKGGSSNLIKVWDGATLVAVIDATVGGTYFYDAKFTTGLTVQSVTGTGADYTVSYR